MQRRWNECTNCFEDVHRRVTEATKRHGRMKLLWRSRKLQKNIKRRLFLFCVCSTLLYGFENWPLPEAASRLTNKFWYEKIRDTFGISWVRLHDQGITNEKCAKMLGVPDWGGSGWQTILKVAWTCRSNGSNMTSSPNPVRFCRKPSAKKDGSTQKSHCT